MEITEAGKPEEDGKSNPWGLAALDIQICYLRSQGLSMDEIGKALDRAPRTIQNRITSMISGLTSRGAIPPETTDSLTLSQHFVDRYGE